MFSEASPVLQSHDHLCAHRKTVRVKHTARAAVQFHNSHSLSTLLKKDQTLYIEIVHLK